MLYMNLHLLSIDDEQANLIASHLGRAIGICDILKKTPYYLAVHRNKIPLEIMARHNVYNDRIYNRTGGEAIVKEEFYDAVLEVAAYARKHLQIVRELKQKSEEPDGKPLPQHCHRAFLLSHEVEYFLDILEQVNFMVFEPEVREISKFKIPYKFFQAARSG